MDIFPWMQGFGSEGSVLSLLLNAFLIWNVYLKPKVMKRNGKDRRRSYSGAQRTIGLEAGGFSIKLNLPVKTIQIE